MKTRALLAGVVILLLAAPAFASNILTVDVNPSVSYQQTLNTPCVIGDKSCGSNQPAGMSYTKYPGTPLQQGDPYDAYSPSYAYTDLVGFLGGHTTFQIGIDENYGTGQGDEVLADLSVWYCPSGTCTTFAANFFDPPSGSHDAALITAGYSLLYTTNTTYALATHNGNGYSDALSSNINIAGLTNAQFIFEGAINNDTDGMEQFFLIPTGTDPVPEPATLGLMGAGFLAVAFALRRRPIK